MQKIIKENKGKNSKHENIQTLASEFVKSAP
jgi:hypothetical protein